MLVLSLFVLFLQDDGLVEKGNGLSERLAFKHGVYDAGEREVVANRRFQSAVLGCSDWADLEGVLHRAFISAVPTYGTTTSPPF